MENSYIGVGSNQGDSIGIIKKALKLINRVSSVKVARVTPLYKTQPLGYTNQPWFYNTAAELEVDITPFQLLDELQEVEKELGRVRTIRWGPRTIDLDILLFGDRAIKHARLIIPHPRMLERAFVMVPLAQLIPYKIIEGSTVKEIAGTLEKKQEIKICKGIYLG